MTSPKRGSRQLPPERSRRNCQLVVLDGVRGDVSPLVDVHESPAVEKDQKEPQYPDSSRKLQHLASSSSLKKSRELRGTRACSNKANCSTVQEAANLKCVRSVNSFLPNAKARFSTLESDATLLKNSTPSGNRYQVRSVTIDWDTVVELRAA